MVWHRCQGLMVKEELRDQSEGKGYNRSSAFRCISCGEVIDPVILQNRRCGRGQTNRRGGRPRLGVQVTGILLITSSTVEFSLKEIAEALPVGPSKGGSMMQRVTVCCFCEKVRDDTGAESGRGPWQDFKLYMAIHRLRPADVRVSHTYCPGCLSYYRNFLASSETAIDRNEAEGGHDGAVTSA
jgi:hypothetical protein